MNMWVTTVGRGEGKRGRGLLARSAELLVANSLLLRVFRSMGGSWKEGRGCKRE